MANVFTEIRTRYHILSKVQKNIADYIFENPRKVILFSIGDLAETCSTSETTIMRFLRKINFKSYQVFKVTLAQELSVGAERSVYEDVRADDDIQAIMRKVLYSTNNSINDLESIVDRLVLEKVVERMVEARRILFTGVGATGLIASDAFYEFAKLGLDVHMSTDPPIMHILAAHAAADDLVFAVSHSGETQDILNCVRLARERGASVVALTSYGDSSLTRLADYVLLSSTTETEYRSDAMLSRITQLVIIDILYVATILRLRPESFESLKRTAAVLAARRGKGR